jgi:rhodanese-related sulfurtransferase
MQGNTAITVDELARRIGTPHAPHIIDVRVDEDHARDPRLLPGAERRDHRAVADWHSAELGREVVVVCQRGLKLSEGTAAWLRAMGTRALSLAGGFEVWAQAGAPLVAQEHVPPRGPDGRTLWVTRARPKIDRIACPWLIRRFVDPRAVFLFVAPSEVVAVGERFGATPFDVEGVFWSHRGPLCTFDVMVEAFGLRSPALDRLATIVRGADTARLDLAPEAAGLLAASLGFSRLFDDDLAQLDAAMGLYDALYLWARDGAAETHNWPAAARMAVPA